MRVPPASVIASWPTPNYTDPPTRGDGLVIVNAVLFTLVTVAVAGRLYSRIFIKRWFGLDDAWIVPAYISDVGLTAVVLLANLRYGWDRHEWDIPFHMIPHAQQVAFAAKILFSLAATFIRMSLMCFYYRLVKDSGIKWFSRVLHVSVAWNVVVCIVFVALSIWLCSPIQAYWIFPPVGHCINEGKTMLGGGIANSITDLWTTILPIAIVMRLQMPLRQRIWVCILLSMGVIVTIAGSVRTYYTWKSLLWSYDTSWWAYYLWVAAAVEIHLGMICACAPAWKSILQEPMKRLSLRVSDKVTSLRSPGYSRDCPTTSKPRSFKPLRSLPWFQVTKLDFERTHQDSSDDGLGQLEKTFEECNALDRSPGKNNRGQFETGGRLQQPLEDPGSVTMRISLEQTSSHLQESPILPGAWIREAWPDEMSRQ